MKKILVCLVFSAISLLSCTGRSSEKYSANTSFTLSGDTVHAIGKSIRCIFQDSRNNYWFATDGEGVFKDDGKTIIRYSESHGLCSNYVWKIKESNDRKMWFKTRDGICYLNDSIFVKANETENILPETNSGLTGADLLVEFVLKPNSVAKIQLPHTSPYQNENNKRFEYDIYCTLKDQKGNLWMGTCTAGVCIFDGKNYTWLNEKELAVPVRDVFEDKAGAIWIGTNGNGLFRYYDGTLSNFSKEHHLDNNDKINFPLGKPGTMSRVWTINEDHRGHIWIGTIDNGVWMYDGHKITNYSGKDGLEIDFIWTIYRDSNNNLLFGTDGAGVFTFDGKRFLPYMTK